MGAGASIREIGKSRLRANLIYNFKNGEYGHSEHCGWKGFDLELQHAISENRELAQSKYRIVN